MKVKDIAAAIQSIAPAELALDWDNVGLLTGEAEKNVTNVMLTIDITKEVLAEAIKARADMIISYHPVIWNGLKKITADGEASVVYELIRAGIAVYSIHTSLDILRGGVNDALAEMLGIVEPKPVGDFVANPAENKFKLVVFTPKDHADKVAQAVYEAGAGKLGNYSNCGFRTQGQGTFLPQEGAKPAIGQQGKFETVEELRFETIVPADKLDATVAAMRQAHPYEMPAFDIFKMYHTEPVLGLGRMGTLAQPLEMEQIIERIKQHTSAKYMGFIGPKKRTVNSAAVCAGSCGKIISSVISAGCDLYLTGELKHHLALAAQEAGLSCICLSHTVSERFMLTRLCRQLNEITEGLNIELSKSDADPFDWKTI